MGGFIKDYRSELNSDIWMMPPLYHRVWQYLKYKVNHSPNRIPMEDGSFFSIEPGQHLTSVRNIAKGVGYYEGLSWKEPNPRTISKILEWLEKQQMITINRGRGNRQYTLVTLLNWGLYQSNGEGGNSKTTASTPPHTPASNHPVHIKKNEEEGLKNEEELKDSTTTTPDGKFAEVIQTFEANLCRLSPLQIESLGMWFSDFNETKEVIFEAIKIADDRNRKSYGFVDYLLKEWANNKLTTVEQIQSHERNKFNNQRQQFSGRRNYGTKKDELVPEWMQEQKAEQTKPKVVKPDPDIEERRRRLLENMNQKREGNMA